MASPYYVAPLGGLDVGEKMTAILEGGKQKYKEQQWEEKGSVPTKLIAQI